MTIQFLFCFSHVVLFSFAQLHPGKINWRASNNSFLSKRKHTTKGKAWVGATWCSGPSDGESTLVS